MAGDSGLVFGSDTGDSVTGGFETFIEPDCMVAQATPIAVDNPAKLMMMIWLVFNDIYLYLLISILVNLYWIPVVMVMLL